MKKEIILKRPDGKDFKVATKEFNIGLMCAMEEMGVNIESAFNAMGLNLTCAYIAYCVGCPIDVAQTLVEDHIINGGQLPEISAIMAEGIKESGFFRKLLQIQEETNPEGEEQETAEETEPEKVTPIKKPASKKSSSK